ncbi:MAG: sulfite exporter TauE/SafE family protein [Ilumatobacteraceae bacterium]
MTSFDVVLLVIAGIGGGLAGSIAGLASLTTYPALLAVGLSPVTANVTNTVALVSSSVGSVSASRPELIGQVRRVRPMAVAGGLGGIAGAALLLLTPAETFELVVPWLIGLASIAILVRRPLIDVAIADAHHAGRTVPRSALAAVGAIGVYAGYFGAGAGVLLLALLLFVFGEAVARMNAVKNVVLGVANGIAAVGMVLFGDVRWSAAVPLAAGLFVGGRIGPVIVRRLPEGPFRLGIAIAGLGLAVKLGLDAYG